MTLRVCCLQAISAHVPMELLVEQIESMQSITKLHQVFHKVCSVGVRHGGFFLFALLQWASLC